MSDIPENSVGKSELEAAAQAPRTSLLRELFSYLTSPTALWIMPIVAVLLLVGLLLLLQTSVVAPFIYPLF